MNDNYSDVIIIGAGAAGLFCAAQLGKYGKRVLILDNGKKIGRKILMSGGGFCNFTNMNVTSGCYLSENRHFVKSALAQFTQWDFIGLVADYGIAWHEKEDGQLFCDNGAQDIVDMLAAECAKYGVKIQLRQSIEQVEQVENDAKVRFKIHAFSQQWSCRSLVIASGGLSMPALGATPFGYQLAEQFSINVVSPRAALVPFTFRETEKFLTALSGVSLPVTVTSHNQSFTHQMLFTHRGLSGPAILQISNYWEPGESVEIDLLPYHSVCQIVEECRQSSPKQQLKTVLSRHLPKKLVELWFAQSLLKDQTVANLSKAELLAVDNFIHCWQFYPNGTEGYRTAEVTMGGVDTREISSKTMESNKIEGLYFIGEVLDVTGRLGGYNFQWAWSSAYVCAVGITGKSERL